MLGVVHADHRAKKFIELDGEVGDICALAALKQVGVAAGLPNIFMFGECPVSRSFRKVHQLDFGEELYGGFFTQCGEHGFTVISGCLPKFGVREIDVIWVDAGQLDWALGHAEMVPLRNYLLITQTKDTP